MDHLTRAWEDGIEGGGEGKDGVSGKRVRVGKNRKNERGEAELWRGGGVKGGWGLEKG